MKSPSKTEIRLRGHHLICLHFFDGEGYDREFVENLREILQKAESGKIIEVTQEADDICRVCPFLKKSKCTQDTDAEKEIREMDRTALQLLQVRRKDIVGWKDIGERIPDIFRQWSAQYCNTCSWRQVCEKNPVFMDFQEKEPERGTEQRIKKLKVNFGDIQKAMEDVARNSFDYYFDRETGEVIPFSEEIIAQGRALLYASDADEIDDDIEYIEFDEVPELPEWIEDEIELGIEILLDESDRYIRIPERTASSAYQSMAEFIETVSDPDLKEKLTAALNGKGAFRKFKDVLIDYPKERKRWHGFNAKAMKKEITEWLQSLGVK